jgi:hypothetical protein
LWVHYRLAELTDPSARAALSAAIHAIGHAPATRADQARLESRVPRAGRGPLPVIACCSAGSGGQEGQERRDGQELRGTTGE